MSLILLNSCKKLSGRDGSKTYAISGRILKDCNGEPVTNYGVRLYFKGGSFGDPSRDLGTDTTDAAGYFSIKDIPVGYYKPLYLYHDINDEEKTIWISNYALPNSPPQEGDLIDLGTFYGSYIEEANVKFNINTSQFNPNDTMYIGTSWGNYHYLNPIPSIFSQTFTKDHPVPYLAVDSSTFGIYWAIGKLFYDSLTKNQHKPDNWRKYYFETVGNCCSDHDTLVMNIP